jgi:hypothetical protein
MVPEFLHPLFIRFITFKPVQYLFVEKFTCVDTVAFKMATATADLLTEVRSKAGNINIPSSMASPSVPGLMILGSV